MKVKMKFDKGAIVGFAVQHAEKFVFAVVIACGAMIVYGAVQRKAYTRTPEELAETTDRADKSVKKTHPDDGPKLDAPPFDEIVDKILKPSVVDEYRYKNSWDDPVFKKKAPRRDPSVFTVEKLCGTAGRDPFQGFAAAPARGRPANQNLGQVGKRWIVITGLVPIKKQRDAYEETFHNVMEPNPLTDVPNYLYYWVERAEVKGSGAKLDWKPLPRDRHKKMAMAEYGNAGHEIIDAKYLEPNGFLAFPLGPRVGGEEVEEDDRIVRRGAQRAAVQSAWMTDPSIAYPPEIPLPQPEKPEGELRTADPPMQVGVMPGDVAARPAGGNEIPGIPGIGDPAAPPPVNPIARPDEPVEQEEKEPEYWLFRFFDFSVEPGKSYRYRVKLALKNPNDGVSARFLDPAVAAKQEKSKVTYLTTDDSNETGVIHVPRDYEVLLASIKPPLRSWDDPSVGMMIVKWVESCGKVAHYTQERVVRGNVLNYHGMWPPVAEETRPTNRDRDDRRDPGMAVGVMPDGVPGAAAARAAPDLGNSIPVSYMTETMVLDIVGLKPGRVILLNFETGALAVCSEAEDRFKVAQRSDLLSEPEPEEPEPGVRRPARPRPRPSRGGGLDGLQVP